MNGVKRVWAITLLLTMIMTSGATSGIAAAQQPALVDNESITLSPVSRKLTLDSGTQINESMTVVNDGKTAYDFIVYSRPYSVSGEDYQPNFTKTPTNADAYSWVRFDKTTYHLEAGQSTKIPFTVRVPAKASPGGHYGVVFAETQPSKDQQNANSVVRKKRVGMLLYVTVNGAVVKEGSILSTTISFWQQQAPLTVQSRVKNTGNTDFTDKTVLTVKDLLGNVKYKASNEHTILPGTTRQVPLEWSGASWFGLYHVEVRQTILDKTTTTNGYVLMLPRFIPVLLVLIVITGGVYVWVRRKKS